MRFAAVHESGSGVRREKAALSSGCKSHPANAPARFNLVINRKTADALA
jgi:hypothetical protein